MTSPEPSPDPAFSAAERGILSRHFSNIDGPVFALTDLPDVVKGALFARYSRSPKSLRRLFLDEFHQDGLIAPPPAAEHAGSEATGVGRAEELYERMLVEYGDDSVAQLVGVHIAVEDASNVLTKILEWGRLLSYLEQSTRYIPYNQKQDGRWRYHVPAEITSASLRDRYIAAMDACFETYAAWFERVEEQMREQFPRGETDSKTAYRLSIRAKTCDILRGLLPAATTANVGIFGSAQGFEALLLRLQDHPLAEARTAGERILHELRQVIPVFMRRVDREDRGRAWSRYLRDTAEATAAEVTRLLPASVPPPETAAYVRLTDFDPDGEIKVLAAAMYQHAEAGDAALVDAARDMAPADRQRLLSAYTGARTNRRHKPGRAFERTSYRFEVVVDYGAFRDLQRHRMLTLDWQPLSPHLGFDVPREIEELGGAEDWRRVMADCASVYHAMREAGLAGAAPYALPMAYRIRFYMQMNAREAMHLIELRTSPQGHPAYRWVGQEMLRRIRDDAGHGAIAASMRFADMEGPAGLERLSAAQRSEERKSALAQGGVTA
jgi:thymidylate synthase ThyX